MSVESGYRHTQIGWVVLGALALPLAALLIFVERPAPAWIQGTIAGLLVVIALLFGTLSVGVGRERIVARFGIGLIRRSIPLADVRSYRRVRNSWYYGWGARLIPGGWMFNAFGLSAVELVLRDGRRFRIGTDEPDALYEALRHELGESAPLGPDEPQPPSNRKIIIVGLVVAALVLVGVGVLLAAGSRPPRIAVGPTGLRVESGLYEDEVPDSRIGSIALLDSLPAIRARTNGFALGSLLRGSFELQDGQRARLYVDADAPPFVEVRHEGGLLIFNAERADETRAIYEALRERLDSGKDR